MTGKNKKKYRKLLLLIIILLFLGLFITRIWNRLNPPFDTVLNPIPESSPQKIEEPTPLPVEIKATMEPTPGSIMATATPLVATAEPSAEPAATSELSATKKDHNEKVFKIPDGFVYIEGGYFEMRSANRIVNLDDFLLSRLEVTQEDFLDVMGYINQFETNNKGIPGKSYSIKDGEKKYPVSCINWYEAVEFCNLLSLRHGLNRCYLIDDGNVSCDWSANGYRLPSEAEWEYAASGGNKTHHFIFAGSNDIDEVAVLQDKMPVGSKKCNELNLYNMSGNVHEWCWDWFEVKKKVNLSNDLDSPKGPDSGHNRVYRGGGLHVDSSYYRVVKRFYLNPVEHKNDLGFRLARNTVQ